MFLKFFFYQSKMRANQIVKQAITRFSSICVSDFFRIFFLTIPLAGVKLKVDSGYSGPVLLAKRSNQNLIFTRRDEVSSGEPSVKGSLIGLFSKDSSSPSEEFLLLNGRYLQTIKRVC